MIGPEHQPFTTPQAVAVALQVNLPAHLIAESGTGKSRFADAICNEWGWGCVTRILATLLPEDIGGYGVAQKGRIARLPDEWIRALLESVRPTVFFADELNNAPAAMQAAFLRVALERYAGGEPLPAHVRIVAASNPPEHATAEGDLRPALANRFLHFNWDPPAWTFVRGMSEGWGFLTRDLRTMDAHEYAKRLPVCKALVGEYIRHRPTALHRMAEGSGVEAMAWPSRRSWDMVSQLEAGCEASGVNGDVETDFLVAAAIGAGGAGEYLAWRRNLDLPDLEKTLADPRKWKVPERADRAFAAVGGMMAIALGRLEHESTRALAWKQAWGVLGHVFRQQRDVAAAASTGIADWGRQHGMWSEAAWTPDMQEFRGFLQEIGRLPKEAK